MLDKEAKNYKEKKTLQHHHQMPVYSKQNHRPNPVINNFPENGNPFCQQKNYQELVHIATKRQDRYKRGKRHQDERGE